MREEGFGRSGSSALPEKQLTVLIGINYSGALPRLTNFPHFFSKNACNCIIIV